MESRAPALSSSPDNKSKLENTAGPTTAEQESNVNSPADERSVDSSQNNQSSSLSSAQQQQQHAVPPPLNGLISIRRSSSKKGNLLPKQHSQSQLDTGIKFAYQQHHQHSKTNQPNFDFVTPNTPPIDNIEFGFNADTVITEDEHIDSRKQDSIKHCCSCTSFHTKDQLTPIDRCTFASDDYFWDKMQSDSVTSTSSAPHCIAESDGNESNASAICSPNPMDLTIENLPAVDTPDACDKAATRLRCLLKLLPRGDVPMEILQKNLHYAARVLEALYIDETKINKNKNRNDDIVADDDETVLLKNVHDNGDNDQVNTNECTDDVDESEDAPKKYSRTTAISLTTESIVDTTDVEQNSHFENNANNVPNTDNELIEHIKQFSILKNQNPNENDYDNQDQNDSNKIELTTQSTTTDNELTYDNKNSPTTLGNDILQKQWHRRLRTPVWARQQSTLTNEKNNSTGEHCSTSNKDNDSNVQRRLADEDDELSEVQPDAVPPEVREWLASTFTRQLVTTRKRTEEKPKFRTVAHAIRAGIFVDRIYRRVSSTAMLQFPPDVVKVLKTLDDWSFDQFALATATNGQPIKYLGYDLLNRYGIIHKFKVAPSVLEQFLVKIEEGYCRYQNPYHNNLHAADVAQTIHYMLCQTGIMHYLTDLEIFAILIAALIHDYEHTGTTNSFHINTGSDMAMLYNDRAVLENHHASAAFRMLKEDEYNIFSNLSREEYKEIRNLVIDMVISTDMSFHNQQLKNMKSLIAIASSDTHYNKTNVDLKFKALSFILHCCDISHPAKKWEIHHRWTMLLIEEFFRQGDLERELGLDISPLCDRNSTVIPKSQIVFIEVIVEPSLAVCADLLELILTPIQSQNTNTSTSTIKSNANNTIDEETKTADESTPTSTSTTIAQNPSQPQRIVIKKPWIACMKENKRIWKEQENAESSSQTSASAGESSASETNAERPSTS